MVQAIKYRKFYCIVIIISALLQFANLVMRILSNNTPSNSGPYIGWFVTILVAPLFTNAFAYMIMGRMVYNFLPDQQLFKTKAWRFTMYFVILDMVAFFIQVIGASAASGTDISKSQIMTGLHIYMGGVGFQEFFILVFLYIAVRFQLRVLRESTPDQQVRGLRLLYVLYAALILITVRIIFRLIEYSSGVNSSIPNHEVYMYVFDTAPMWIAIFLFNVVHPGAYMPGKQSEWPSRKERKRQARQGRESTVELERLQQNTKAGLTNQFVRLSGLAGSLTASRTAGVPNLVKHL